MNVLFETGESGATATTHDWLKVRTAKRAPLTPTAWDDVKAEATKAGFAPRRRGHGSPGPVWHITEKGLAEARKEAS